MSRLGVVIIGRNEGERLRRCLASVSEQHPTVYVDSGSTDGSVALARSVGVHVVELDPLVLFNAARARNAGFAKLVALTPEIEFVQFVDGDCELAPGWIELAKATIQARPDAAIVCGQVRERFREASIYNRLCDLEWYRQAGEVRACGGIALMRAAVIAEAGGYPEGMIAGEEGELCFRLRARGWKVVCLPELMTLHDAAIFSLRQWCRRQVRSGHAYAEGMAMHGASPERYNVRPVRSAIIWGMVIPMVTLALIVLAAGMIRSHPAVAATLTALPLGLWGLFLARILLAQRRLGRNLADAILYTLFIPPAKVAHCVGAATFWLNYRRGRHTGLIEYKTPVISSPLPTGNPTP